MRALADFRSNPAARPRADADLPWYFGSGPQSAMGECGLRSPLGAQLELMQSGQLCDGRTVDASALEEAMHRRIGTGDRISRIQAALRGLSSHDVAVLRLHYGGGSLPYGVDPVAALLPACAALVANGGEHPQDLRGALHDLPERERWAIRAEADRMVAVAIEAYERSGR